MQDLGWGWSGSSYLEQLSQFSAVWRSPGQLCSRGRAGSVTACKGYRSSGRAPLGCLWPGGEGAVGVLGPQGLQESLEGWDSWKVGQLECGA